MNDYIAAIIIGIVEGLTEFLPVSSTAHIRFTQKLLGISEEDSFWKMFAIVIQLGAILSVVVYFWSRLYGFVSSFFQRSSARVEEFVSDESNVTRSRWQHPLVLVMLAFVVSAIPCFLIEKIIDDNLEKLSMMGIALIVGGVLMWVIDVMCTKNSTTSVEQMNWRQSVVIGLMQIFAAAFPGTSRSMSTIAGGQIMGLNRATALEFSFFLSIPVMFAATLYKLAKFILKAESAVTNDQWGVLSVGFITSFIVALAVIAWFMHWVRQRGFVPFAIYRIIAGCVVLWLFAR